MTKIVINTCFGGFGLSEKAMQRYAEIKGWTFKNKVVTDGYSYLVVVDEKGEEFSDYDLESNRTDTALVQVVEELGKEASGWAADLCIFELPAGTKYRIDEYDGSESIETENDILWTIA